MLWWFARGGPVAADGLLVIGATLIYVLIIGAVIAAVCGYMAGLIGASNSPVSGVGILAVLAAAVLLSLFYGSDPANAQALTAYALFTTAIVFSIATISNDNLQDLKTGQLVGATPWRQQVALVIGVIFGSLVIAPVLNVLNEGFGFQGMPGAGPNALAAPQAALISSLANGVLGGDIKWDLIGYGALIGVAVIVVDEALGKTKKYRLPPLAVGMGIYLPMALTLLIPVGALIGHLYERWADAHPQPRIRQADGRAGRDGLHRRREPVRRRLRWHRRRFGQRRAARLAVCRRGVRSLCALDRRARLRGADRLALCADEARRRLAISRGCGR